MFSQFKITDPAKEPSKSNKVTAPQKTRGPVSRYWCFTLNNQAGFSNYQEITTCIDYGVWQLEIAPTTGTEHIQGYLVFSQRTGLARLKKLEPAAHWEARKGTHAQAVAYCKKEDTRKPGTEPFEIGVPPPESKQGERTDLADIQDLCKKGANMLEIAESNFGAFLKFSRSLGVYKGLVQARMTRPTPTITVLYGLTRTGKSLYAEHLAGLDAYWYIPQTNHRWWDAYDGQKTVVMDEFYGQGYPHEQLLRLWDRYKLQVETKGGTTYMRADNIIVTSNKSPEEWYWKLFAADPAKWDQLRERITNIVYFEDRDTRTVMKGELPPLKLTARVCDVEICPYCPKAIAPIDQLSRSDLQNDDSIVALVDDEPEKDEAITESRCESENPEFPAPDPSTCASLDDELNLKEIAYLNGKRMRAQQRGLKKSLLSIPVGAKRPFVTLAELSREDEEVADDSCSSTDSFHSSEDETDRTPEKEDFQSPKRQKLIRTSRMPYTDVPSNYDMNNNCTQCKQFWEFCRCDDTFC